MGDELSSIGGLESTKRPRPTTEVRINKVVNGYTVGGYGVDLKIANTLDEAVALARKEFGE